MTPQQSGLVTRLRSTVRKGPAETFRQYDSLGRGYLEYAGFERFVKFYLGNITFSEIRCLWDLVDRQRNGKVTLQDFCILFNR